MKSTITTAELNQFTGTTQYFHHWSKKFKYTDGVFFVAEAAGAFWLLDIVASYQPLNEPFQVWTLLKEGEFYSVECTDGNDVIVVRQDLDYTDFPEDILPFSFWLENNVLMLPSER